MLPVLISVSLEPKFPDCLNEVSSVSLCAEAVRMQVVQIVFAQVGNKLEAVHNLHVGIFRRDFLYISAESLQRGNAVHIVASPQWTYAEHRDFLSI